MCCFICCEIENTRTLNEGFYSNFIFIVNNVKDEVKKILRQIGYLLLVYLHRGKGLVRGLIQYDIEVKMFFGKQSRISCLYSMHIQVLQIPLKNRACFLTLIFILFLLSCLHLHHNLPLWKEWFETLRKHKIQLSFWD